MAIAASDTIAAVATPAGLGAIAVVRVSGPQAVRVAAALGANEPELAPRRASLRRLADTAGASIDECLVTWFPAPASFTGEDVVELSCHGGFATVRALYHALIAAGARPADPGEFSKRAFLNGKLDLAQAEGLNQLIRARTRLQADAARQAYEGAMSVRVRAASERLLAASAALEASIDFPEDVDEPPRQLLVADLSSVRVALDRALEVASRGSLLSGGIRMAIAGRPNVGKSSLLNLLAGRSRAIVSAVPGTTRDFLEEHVEIAGLPVLAVDTAGIRETDDPIEREGTRRAADAAAAADVCLIVLDAAEGLTDDDSDVLALAAGKGVAVWNKTDLAPAPCISSQIWPGVQVAICCLDGTGLEALESAVLEVMGAGAGHFEEAVAATERQVQALKEALDVLDQAIAAAESPIALDLAAVSLQTCRRVLGEITGESATETLIESIFSSFCIGK